MERLDRGEAGGDGARAAGDELAVAVVKAPDDAVPGAAPAAGEAAKAPEVIKKGKEEEAAAGDKKKEEKK